MDNLNSVVGRTADVARGAGYSVQQVRNLERAGVLPPAERTAGGHRVYRRVHLSSALAYRALAAGAGPVEARAILRAVQAGRTREALAALDEVHARLHTERVDLGLAVRAAAAMSGEPIAEVRGSDALTIAELAGALGIRASALRHWEVSGLVVPDRAGTARRYSPTQVRDARIVHQLRQAGYRIPQLRAVLPELVRAGGSGDLRAALAAREDALTARSLALVDGAAALAAVLQSAAGSAVLPDSGMAGRPSLR
ncbi:MerR family transcriptional regulator [Nocardia sp. SSK8]|uniref:MerR family transcriptional regulator n=1 Tax=Nocardia sp. SSK8 TaxID=3120154 RepID=UPI00300A6C74